MLSNKGNSNKVFHFLYYTNVVNHISLHTSNASNVIDKCSRTCMQHDEDKVTIKEESSFCSVSLLLNIYFFCFRMLVWTFNYSLEQLQTNTH